MASIPKPVIRRSSKRLPAATPDSDRHWCGDGEDSQGALKQRSAGDVSLLADSAVCAKDAHAGGIFAVAVSERHQQRRDGRGAWSAAGAESQRDFPPGWCRD